MFTMSNEYYAILSGVCAALASILGKFATSSDLDNLFLARAVFFILMVVSNTFVWMLLVKALHKTHSSLTTISVSTATNYLVSGICGYIIFGELTFMLWFLGTVLILCGLSLIISEEEN